jgi:protein-S-isoprenylcysteine O-methyltransferase Ste14
MASDLKRRATNATGICLIAGVFTVEVSFMHSKMPNAATPWVLGVLGLTALGALVAACWWNLKAKGQA